ncbi:alpha-amylase family glycosyl hydrolase [Nannocystis exedens]|nr:alpha-amylase family glycosyl hydrolase [Nannocystis exedens]
MTRPAYRAGADAVSSRGVLLSSARMVRPPIRLVPALLLLGACSSGAPTPGETDGATTGGLTNNPSSFPGTDAASTAPPDPTSGTTTGTTAEPTTTDDPTGGGVVTCPTRFRFDPPAGGEGPRVAGEWNGFDLASATWLEGPDPDGMYQGTVDLPPGLHGYKVVYSQGGADQWVLDPGQGRRKYVGGTENSAVLVRDCRLPGVEVAASQATRPGPGAGAYSATLRYIDGLAGAGPATGEFTATLRTGSDTRPLTGEELVVDPATGDVTIALADLPDGKHRVTVTVASADGHTSEPILLPFWIEAEPFRWDDALVYMVLTDRFRDGEPGDSPGPTPMADPRGDWDGGDLEGLRAAIANGTLDQLGVRAIWLTPFQTNPQDAFKAADGVHWVTGYHGYWPIRAREVDPRLGGEAALSAMIDEAHRHGIRVLQDYVINHVHAEHEYMQAHPEWFRTGCVCGTPGCDWTEKALECMFADYLPDIDHSVTEANAQFVADAAWWLDEFDLDGLRVDAVKHVEEAATRNLAAAVREGFERAGTKYFLMGETAMGWNDCADPCNDDNYGTIARYIGPFGLDGQFDFVLYHGVSYRTFAWGDSGMLHADYWVQHGLGKWPAGAVMTPYIGSHDTPRFVSHADYRGQDGQHDKGVPGNQWDNTAVAPGDAEPYRRARLALTWLFGLPGAPLLYYGDEYGQWGGADPNNRLMWRPEDELSADELATLAHTRKLGTARQQLAPLRRGAYVPLYADEDTLVFGRKIADGDAAIVALTRAGAPQMVTVDAGPALGFAAATELTDALAGGKATVTALGKLSFTIPAGGSLIFAP